MIRDNRWITGERLSDFRDTRASQKPAPVKASEAINTHMRFEAKRD